MDNLVPTFPSSPFFFFFFSGLFQGAARDADKLVKVGALDGKNLKCQLFLLHYFVRNLNN
jgi:hypothetical protein